MLQLLQIKRRLGVGHGSLEIIEDSPPGLSRHRRIADWLHEISRRPRTIYYKVPAIVASTRISGLHCLTLQLIAGPTLSQPSIALATRPQPFASARPSLWVVPARIQ